MTKRDVVFPPGARRFTRRIVTRLLFVPMDFCSYQGKSVAAKMAHPSLILNHKYDARSTI